MTFYLPIKLQKKSGKFCVGAAISESLFFNGESEFATPKIPAQQNLTNPRGAGGFLPNKLVS
jgi:hypothetical protein